MGLVPSTRALRVTAALSSRPWTVPVAGSGFGLWALGVQISEAVATGGLALMWLGFLGHVLANPSVLANEARRWWPLWAFVGGCLLGPLLVGRLPTGSGISRLVDWLSIPLGMWAVGALDDTWRRRLVVAAAVALLLSSLLAGLQHFGLWPALEAFQPLQWTRLPFHRVYETVPGADDRFMGGGLLFHRLKFAHVSGLVVLVSVALAAEAKRRESGFAWLSLAAVALLGWAAIGVFSFARAAAAAVTVALAVFFLRAWGRRGVIAVAALLVVGAGLLWLQPSVRERWGQSLTHEGSGERTEHWRLGWRAFEQYFPLGMGAGQYQPQKVADAQTSDVVRENPGKAHLQLLSIAAEGGVLGVALFLIAWFSLWRRARHRLGDALTVYFLVLSLGHDPLYQAPFSMGLMVAWVVALELGALKRLENAQRTAVHVPG